MTPREPGKRKSFAARVSQNRAGDPFYWSPAWKALRAARLALDRRLCRSCERNGATAEATEVDHVLPRAARPDLELALNNLESLCKSCHSRKTMGEQRRQPGGA